MQHEIRGAVGQDRRFEAVLPEEIAGGDSKNTVEEDGTPDQQGGQLDQTGSGWQMPQAKDHRREDIGEPQRQKRWLASRQMPGEADKPCQQREQEQAAQNLLIDAAVEGRQEAFPQRRYGSVVRMAEGRRGQNTKTSRSSRTVDEAIPRISAGAIIATA